MEHDTIGLYRLLFQFQLINLCILQNFYMDINGDFMWLPHFSPSLAGHQLPGAAALSRRPDRGLRPLSQRLLRPRRAAAEGDAVDPGEAQRPLWGLGGGGMGMTLPLHAIAQYCPIVSHTVDGNFMEFFRLLFANFNGWGIYIWIYVSMGWIQ